jgi:hypothetical protein
VGHVPWLEDDVELRHRVRAFVAECGGPEGYSGTAAEGRPQRRGPRREQIA